MLYRLSAFIHRRTLYQLDSHNFMVYTRGLEISQMRLAKTSSSSAKFETLTCKNFSFHGNLNDRNNMAERFSKFCGKTVRAKGNYHDMETAENVQRSWSQFRRFKVEGKGHDIFSELQREPTQLTKFGA